MIRKPGWNEIVVMLFSLQVWFALVVDPTLFTSGGNGKSEQVYSTYVGIVGSQQAMAYLSIFITLIYLGILFTNKLKLMLFVHTVGLIYYFFVTAGFLINYPNLAFGIMAIISIGLFIELLNLIDLIEEVRKNQILNDFESEYNYKTILEKDDVDDENEQTENHDGSEQKGQAYEKVT